MADRLSQCGECLGLSDHVNVSVLIRFPAFATHDPAGLASAGGISGARHGAVEATVEILRIFLEGTVSEPLLVAQLYAAEIQDHILHRACDALSPACLLAL